MSSVREFLAGVPGLRRAALRALEVTARDITITHPWTDSPLLLNSFRHRGYWYFGRERESDTMRFIRRWVTPGSVAIDVGGHIGFISQYLGSLVGSSGKVFVFEPGETNLRYLERNLSSVPAATLVRCAVSSVDGEAAFFDDGFGGFTNSVLPDWTTSEINTTRTFREAARIKSRVKTRSLDSFCDEMDIHPSFIKIDVEGHECDVLRGAARVLQSVQAVVIEVSRDGQQSLGYLRDAGLEVHADSGVSVEHLPDSFHGNVLAYRA